LTTLVNSFISGLELFILPAVSINVTCMACLGQYKRSLPLTEKSLSKKIASYVLYTKNVIKYNLLQLK
ncbi:MAG: hypothetical protein WAK17_03780, partial [Candidatus Nitrosopolaris sp.]